MSSWEVVLRPPEPVADDSNLEAWFGRIADRLLNGSRLLAGGGAHRLVEVEAYYHSRAHPDPFTHRDPLQRECGRWYFHCTRGTYRSGSFKGLDLTFGSGDAFGGMLIRGLEAPGGKLIDGPSLLVDHLLDVTGAQSVAQLDAAIASRVAWDPSNPLRLVEAPGEEPRLVYRSARVGLSLKRAGASSDMPRFILRSYRYLTEPRRTAKGKPLLVLALHAQGMDAQAISQLTGCPRKSVDRYITDCETGRGEAGFGPYLGIDLSPHDLCRLHGTWHTHVAGKGQAKRD
jgi:hypothetical protein